MFDQVKNSGEYFDGHHALVELFPKVGNDLRNFLEKWDNGKISREIQQIQNISDVDRERIS